MISGGIVNLAQFFTLSLVNRFMYSKGGDGNGPMLDCGNDISILLLLLFISG